MINAESGVKNLHVMEARVVNAKKLEAIAKAAYEHHAQVDAKVRIKKVVESAVELADLDTMKLKIERKGVQLDPKKGG